MDQGAKPTTTTTISRFHIQGPSSSGGGPKTSKGAAMSTNEIIRRLNELAQQVENNMVATYHGESGIDPDSLPEWQDRVASFQSLMEEAMEHLSAASALES